MDDATRSLVAFVLFAGVALTSYAQSQGALHVNLTRPANTMGNTWLAVCTKDQFLGDNCAVKQQLAPTQTQFAAALPPGTYAVQAFVDENNDGTLNQNFLGFPSEPMGFSGQVDMRYGPPRFADAAVVVHPGQTTTTRVDIEN